MNLIFTQHWRDIYCALIAPPLMPPMPRCPSPPDLLSILPDHAAVVQRAAACPCRCHIALMFFTVFIFFFFCLIVPFTAATRSDGARDADFAKDFIILRVIR